MGNRKKRAVMKKTKIICTIGPASKEENILKKLIMGGMDLARINTSHSDSKEVIKIDYNKFIEDVREGSHIFIDDGLVECKVLNVDIPGKAAVCEVITGGLVGSRKGINLPGVSISAASVTRKDLEFLNLGLKLEVDLIAQSFVRNSYDVEKIKKVI